MDVANNLPQMPLWVYDIDTDETCRLMGFASFGAYIRCLMRQWIEGSLPADPESVAKLIGGASREAMRLLGGFLDAKFPIDTDGRRRNPKLAAIREEKAAKVEKNRQNGRLGGRPTDNHSVSETETDCQSQEKPNGPIRASGSGSGSGSGEGGAGETPMPDGFDTPEFRAAWEDFRTHRREKRKPMRPRGEQMLLRQVAPFGPDWAIARIQKAIASDWQGLVFDSDVPPGGKPKPAVQLAKGAH